MKSFTDKLEVKEVRVYEDRRHPFVYLKFLDPQNAKSYSESRCFFGTGNVDFCRSLKAGDKVHVETNEYDKYDKGSKQYKHVVLRRVVAARES